MISLAKERKNENGKICHYSFKMVDNDLKIWQNNLLPNPFHMVDAKFDLVLRPISHENPAMLCYAFVEPVTNSLLALKFQNLLWRQTRRIRYLKIRFKMLMHYIDGLKKNCLILNCLLYISIVKV